MGLKPISKRDKRTKGISLSIGVDGRMYLSKGLREVLDHKDKASYFLYFDEYDERIGIAKQEPDTNVIPFSFNKSGEGRIVEFIEDCEIDIPGKPVTWIYEGKQSGILIFFKKGVRKKFFRQERNGNLISV